MKLNNISGYIELNNFLYNYDNSILYYNTGLYNGQPAVLIYLNSPASPALLKDITGFKDYIKPGADRIINGRKINTLLFKGE